MYARAKAQGTAKVNVQPLKGKQKAKLARARAQTAAATRAQNQMVGAARLYRQVGTMENKFFDPWTADGSKQIDFTTTGTLANAAGGYILTGAAVPAALVINQIAQGVSQLTRLGRKAHCTGVHIKARVTQPAAGAITSFSLNLVHQKPPNNPTQMPAFNDVWVAQHVNALRNVDNADKLQVVRSIKGTLVGNSNTPATGLEEVLIDEFIDLRKYNCFTEWTQADTTGVYTNMEKGALMLYCLSDAAANAAQGFLSVRVYFNDY